MLENAMLVIGISPNKYRVGEIIPSGNEEYVKDNFGLESALVTGQKNQTTIPKVVNDLNTVLTFF